jgi:N-methylhydantoinase B
MPDPNLAARARGTATDALGAEILRHALRVAAEEASLVVVRSGHSVMIADGADACAALLDARGQLVALSTATNLMHASSLRSSLPALLEDHPPATQRPGDVFVMNDVYRGGIHANDLLIFRPIFVEGVVAYFAGTLIHVADLGGVSAGGLAANATDVFWEGLQLPPVRLFDAGEPVRDLHRILEHNSRSPERVMGDVRALVAGATVAARRTSELVLRYGAAELARGIAAYLDGTEARMRAELGRLAPGTYCGSYGIDDDGVQEGRSHTVRVAARVGRGEIALDFEGTDPAAAGSINAGFSQALTGAIFAVRCFVDPSLPMNEGCFRPVEVRLPHGSLLNPRPPAACGGRVVAVCAATEAIVRALSAARPERATAASSVIHPYTLSGRGEAGRWLLLSYEFGGLGARMGSDGPSATGAFFLGGRNTVPQVEPIEARLPLVFERQALIPDSGGPGRTRGGLGVETRVRLLADAEVSVRAERVRIPPQGLAGGADGRPGGNEILRVDGSAARLPGKATNHRMAAGETFVLRSSGGGGLGPAAERDPAAVLADVREGFVSREAALRDYAVALDAAGATVDAEATARRRARS